MTPTEKYLLIFLALTFVACIVFIVVLARGPRSRRRR